jgi:predicted small lipoprotein YifL
MKLLTVLLMLSCLALAGCGQKGPLVQPPAKTYVAGFAHA